LEIQDGIDDSGLILFGEATEKRQPNQPVADVFGDRTAPRFAADYSILLKIWVSKYNCQDQLFCSSLPIVPTIFLLPTLSSLLDHRFAMLPLRAFSV